VILASFDVVNSQIPIAVIHFSIPFFFDDESPPRDPPGLGAPSSGYSAFVPGIDIPVGAVLNRFTVGSIGNNPPLLSIARLSVSGFWGECFTIVFFCQNKIRAF
jgi:hypothetical protein